MKRGLVLIVLVLISGACSPAGSDPVASKKEEAEERATGNAALVVGDPATTTEDGNTLTVLSYESPLMPAGSYEPEPGFELSAIEAEGCSSSSSGRDFMQIGSSAFVLMMPDGTRVIPLTDAEETGVSPVLQNMDPKPGQCDRGFIVFQTPLGERPEAVIFEEQFTSEAMPVEWAIPVG